MTNTEKSAAVGGFLWIVATVQYFVAQFVVAAQWRPPYSWRDNYVSDLGNTACGPFMSNHVCSPLAGLMNASLVVAGLLTITGVGLQRLTWPPTSLASVGALLWILAGAGKVLVGVAPENENLPLHVIGTLNLPFGAVAALLLSLATRHTGLGVVVAGCGLLGLALTIFAPALLGVGGADRLAGYPTDIWLFVAGAAALRSRRESAQILAQMP